MFISGFIKTSFVDYEGFIASVVFTKGCNMICEYCHNKDLLSVKKNINEEEVFKYLRKRQGLIDGVVISGGEPTLQKGLVDFIKKVKSLDYLIKLDTNGTNATILAELINEKLVNFVAMDIKTVPLKYKELTGIDYKEVEKSIELVKGFANHEFRTTVYPKINADEIRILCNEYEKYNYVIQQYRKNNESDIEPYKSEWLKSLIKPYKVKFRGNKDN